MHIHIINKRNKILKRTYQICFYLNNEMSIKYLGDFVCCHNVLPLTASYIQYYSYILSSWPVSYTYLQLQICISLSFFGSIFATDFGGGGSPSIAHAGLKFTVYHKLAWNCHLPSSAFWMLRLHCIATTPAGVGSWGVLSSFFQELILAGISATHLLSQSSEGRVSWISLSSGPALST